MEVTPLRIPFIGNRPPMERKSSYWRMLVDRFFPHFHVLSLTSLILLIIIIAFILPRVFWKAPSYVKFLVLPSPQMDKWALDIQLIKSNRSYFYQVATAMFLHQTYLHFIGNFIFSVFIMYELENCWAPGILVGLLCGIGSHFMAILIGEGRYLGFSGVLSSYFAIYVAAIIINCPYIQRTQPNYLWFTIIFAVMMSFMVIGSGKSALVHLFGYLFGLLFGVAFYPTNSQSIIPPSIHWILKLVVIGLFLLTGVLAFLA